MTESFRAMEASLGRSLGPSLKFPIRRSWSWSVPIVEINRFDRDQGRKRWRSSEKMPRSKSRSPCFLKVRCTDCENEQVLYSHSSSEIECQICGKTLAEPRGGKAQIKTEILGEVG